MNPIVKWLRAICALGVAALVFAQVPPPRITTTSPLPNATLQSAYNQALAATSGSPPYTWSLNVDGGPLPPGLSLSSGGVISGAPTATGTYNFLVDLLDSQRQGASMRFALTVQQPPPLTITSSSPLPNGTATASYSYILNASGGAPPYNWGLTSGNLPPGLSLSSSGQITGTPSTAGTFQFGVFVSDNAKGNAQAQFSLTIQASKLTITSQSPAPSGAVGVSYSFSFAATGGSPPYNWSVIAGNLPPGLTLAPNGSLTGTPTTTGLFGFTIQVSDSPAQSLAAQVSTLLFSLRVTQSLTVTTPSPINVSLGAMNLQIPMLADGGAPPYGWSVVSGSPLPPGFTLNGGFLQGSATTAGSFTFTMQVTDQAGATATKAITLIVQAQQPPPSAQLSLTSLDFSAPAGGDAPAPQNFALISSAAQGLQFTIQIDGGLPGTPAAWLNALLLKGSTPARIPVAVDQTGLPAGSYAGRILVNTSDGRQSIVTVSLTVTAGAQMLKVDPDFLAFAGSVTSLAAAEQDLMVRNIGGGGMLTYQASVQDTAPWLSVAPASGQAGPNAPGIVRVLVNAQGLAKGAHRGAVRIVSSAGNATVTVTVLVRDSGPVIAFDRQGVLFDARANNGDANTEVVNVLNRGDGTVNWQAQIEFISGGVWATLGASSGQATAAKASPLPLSATFGAIAPGSYYALVRVTDPNAINSPQFFTAVLNLASANTPPRPQPVPEGLLFVGKSGSPGPAAQKLTVFASSSMPVPFQAAANTSDGGNWLLVSPASGSTSTQSPAQVTVTVNTLTLKPGIYRGDVTLSLSSTETRSTTVTAVVQPATVGVASPKAREAVPGCTPAKLALAPTSLSNSFAEPAGWPTALMLQLADDCGSPVLNGQVIATFSNGDPALTMKLTDSSAGTYSATWAPSKVTDSMTVTAHASAPPLAAATVDLTGSVTPNKVPVLTPHGTGNNLNPIIGAPVAPGTIALVFGSGLATVEAQPNTVPEPTTFNGTRMLVGAFEAPLYFLSDGQLDVQIPTELKPDNEYPIVVQANGGLTLPDTLLTAAATPGLISIGQHLDYSSITADSPAAPGDTIYLYLVGMGATTPPVASGAGAPAMPFAKVDNQPTVTIGGRQADVLFAGLSPGAVGLYQVIVTLPTGLPSGNLPIVVTQNGVPANAATLPVK